MCDSSILDFRIILNSIKKTQCRGLRRRISCRYSRDCGLLSAIKSVLTEAIKKSFKRTLFALPADGSRDEIDGSKRLNQLIKIAPTFEELPEAYRFKVCSIFDFESISYVIQPIDDFGIRRKKGSAEKYKNRAFECSLCEWGYANKSHPKVTEDCPAIWIYEERSPQPLANLKFVKS